MAAKERWETVTDDFERSRLIQQACGSIDRTKQGAATSKGLKKFWEGLKGDPIR